MSNYPAYSMPKKTRICPDPRTKVILMFYMAVMLTFRHEDIIFVSETIVLSVILLFSNLQFKTAVIYGILYTFAIPAKISQGQNILPPIIESIGILYSALILRLFPTFMLGYYLIKSTSVSEFTAAMMKWRISKKLIIPVLVVFRFIPTIAEESRSISIAMKMREVGFGTKRFRRKPGILVEYRIIPLMISVVKIGEELSAAALSKGLDSEAERTNIADIGFGPVDILLLIILVVMTFGGIIQ